MLRHGEPFGQGYMMLVFGFLLAVAYIPNVTGHAILTGWIVLTLALPFLPKGQLGAAHWLGLAFLAYAAASLAWAMVPVQGVWELWLLVLLGGCFAFGTAVRDPCNLWLGLSLGFGVSTAIAGAQWFGWQGIYHIQLPAGLFVNSGIYGEVGAILTLALISVRLYWPIVFTAPALALSGSRLALAAVAIGLLIHFKSWKAALVALALAGSIFYVTSTQRTQWASVSERVAMWKDTVDGLTLFGRGAGSFLITYPAFASRTDTMTQRPEDPHNEFLRFAYEYGLGTAAIAAILLLSMFAAGPERTILIPWLFIAFFDFPTRIPVLALVGMVCLGMLCARSLERRYAWPAGLGEKRYSYG